VGFSVENICGFLIRGRLMTPGEMRAMYQSWQKSAGADAAHLDVFLKWLVASGYVTEYQANLLAQGHGEGFYINQYKILERIGRGRMAGVFRAVHQLGQVVAIKVLPPSRAKSPQLLARFQREAQLSLRLKHLNVVRSFQVGEAEGLHYLVMEYLEGETLDELLRRRGTLSPSEAVRLAHQTLLGLQHIHEQGMVHRDVKPANLFLTSVARSPLSVVKESEPVLAAGLTDQGPRSTDATVKILDIGLARELFEEAPPNRSGNPSEITDEGILLGTPDYLAPEQARDARRSDIRADIYSVGCVLYQMLVGQPPFPDRNLFNQIVRHATEPPKPLRSFDPSIPEGLEQIVAWMIAKQPEQRYATPARAAQALEVFLLAGSEAQTMEDAPQLRRYLTWLEAEERTPVADDTTVIAPPPAAVPAVPPAPRAPTPIPTAAPAIATAAPAVPRAAPVARPVIPVPAPAPATAPAPAPNEIDVELVAPSELAVPDAPLIAAPPKPKARGAPKGLIVGVIVAAAVLGCGCTGIGAWAIMWLLG
jgi:serine/threonine protein kinase